MTKKHKKIWLSVCGFFCTLMVVFGLGTNLTSAEAVLSDVAVKEEYTIGQAVDIPDATITIDGEVYNTVKSLIYPDGRIKCVDELVARESGQYIIKYQTQVEDKLFEKNVSFSVKNDLFSVSDKESTLVYGTNEYFPDTVQGLNLCLASGDEFVYNRVINVNNLTKSDELLRFYVTPKEKGSGEFNQMYVKLTDIYNPENYISVKYQALVSEISWAWDRLYTSAAANGQPYMGLEYAPRATSGFTYEGKFYNVHKNDRFGLPCQSSFNGELFKYTSFEQNYNFLSLDYLNKKLYAQKSTYSEDLIIDLDEPSFYGENLWQGFTTGEVLLSVYFDGYVGNLANIFISDIIDGDTAERPFKDEVKPNILVDFKDYSEENLPKAYLNKKYNIFNATAYDNLEGEVGITTFVYYNYYGSGRSLVQLVDGAFIPKRTGVYTIEYSAKDSLGNTAYKTVDIVCDIQADSLQIELGEYQDTCDVMSEISIADYAVRNNNGICNVNVVACLKGTDVLYPILENTFIPLKIGTYEIVYTATDYTDEIIVKYELQVNSVQTPVFTQEAKLPRYFIKGATYTLGALYATDLSGAESKTLETEIYIKEDGKGEAIKSNGSYIVRGDNFAEIAYKAKNEYETVTKSWIVPIVDVKYGDIVNLELENYFQGEGFIASINEQAASYEKEFSGEKNAYIDFIKEINVNEFRFDFSVPVEYWNFETLDILLSDAKDANNTLKITFRKEGDNRMVFYVNDYLIKQFSYEYNGMPSAELYYNRKANIIKVNGENDFELNSVDDLFKGFSGNLGNLRVQFNGVKGDLQFNVSRLLMQAFNSTALDFMSPSILAREEETINGEKDGSIKIVARDYFDLLDPCLKINFSVLDPSGNPIVALDGTVLQNADPGKDYEIPLMTYGSYQVQYYAEDFSGNTGRYSYIVTVKDNKPPQADILGNSTTLYTHGQTVTIAEISATDDNSEVSVYTVLIKPDGKVMQTEKTFVADVKGTYYIYYYVSDSNGNVTLLYYTITVS